jgi:hypothetical protein
MSLLGWTTCTVSPTPGENHASGRGTPMHEKIRHCVVVLLDPSVEVDQQMQGFPFQPGESWFSAIDHAHLVYICIDRPLMTPQQSAWVLQHAVKWDYV